MWHEAYWYDCIHLCRLHRCADAVTHCKYDQSGRRSERGSDSDDGLRLRLASAPGTAELRARGGLNAIAV